MKTVKEVSEITGVSIRALRFYDEIGLLKPTTLTDANYRLYDDDALERLQQILFFRKLEIPLSDIKAIMENPKYDKLQILGTQKLLLELKRNLINRNIELISNVMRGDDTANFETFNDNDIQKMIEQVMQRLSIDPPSKGSENFESIEEFVEYGTTILKNEYLASSMIEAYGSKAKAIEAFICGVWDKTSRKDEDEAIYHQLNEARKSGDKTLEKEAIKRLEAHWQAIAKRDDVRSALLKLADSYLHNDGLIESTDKRWDKGSSKYIGLAIHRYFEAFQI